MKEVYAVAFASINKSRDVIPDLVFVDPKRAEIEAKKRESLTAPQDGEYIVLTLYVQDDSTLSE